MLLFDLTAGLLTLLTVTGGWVLVAVIDERVLGGGGQEVSLMNTYNAKFLYWVEHFSVSWLLMILDDLWFCKKTPCLTVCLHV